MSSDAGSILEADHVHLDKLLGDVVDALNVDAELTYRALDLFWARLAMHIRAEHVVLFPALRESDAFGQLERHDIPKILDELRHDHDFFMTQLARAIKALRLVFHFGNESETIEVVRRVVEEVKTRLEQHNRIEEETVYPVIASIESSSADMVGKIIKELENLPPRFRSDTSTK